MSVRAKLALGLFLLAVGSCEGTDSGGTGPTSFDLTGTFEGVIVLRADPFTGFVDSIPLSLALTHSGASFTGTWEADSAAGTITGTVTGGSISFTLRQNVPCDGTFTGTAVATFDGARLRGTLSGSDCTRTLDATFVVDRTSAPPAPPRLVLTPASIKFSGTVGGGDPGAATIAVSNSGGGTVSGLTLGAISYDSSASGWLTTPVLGGTAAPATITLHATTGSLAAGTYTATIPVTSTSASNSPQTITVTFVISDVPATTSISLSSDSLTFSAMEGGADPAASTVNVTNGGGGSLTGLDVGSITYGPGASGWLTAGLATTTAPATLTLQATTGSLAAGTYTATVPVTSDVAANSPQNVTVTFTVVAPSPSKVVTPTVAGG